ncbi:MAG TPA: lipid II flippase MurJ, partial [Candidatus Limnocylindrales bacterium]|nr:lipid II flippase MurJ [Candidatus Limnocylindrales bacterium]
LGYGRFDQAAVQLTADTLFLFLLGLTAHSAIAVLTRAFYARQDTRTPMVAAVLAVVINTLLAVALVGSLGLPAIGLAIAVAAWAEALLLLAVLRRREGPGLDLGALASVLARIFVAAVVAGGVGYVVLQSVGALVPGGAGADLSSLAAKAGLLAQSVIVTVAGGAAYAAVSWVLGVRELRTIVAILADLIRRRGAS